MNHEHKPSTHPERPSDEPAELEPTTGDRLIVQICEAHPDYLDELSRLYNTYSDAMVAYLLAQGLPTRPADLEDDFDEAFVNDYGSEQEFLTGAMAAGDGQAWADDDGLPITADTTYEELEANLAEHYQFVTIDARVYVFRRSAPLSSRYLIRKEHAMNNHYLGQEHHEDQENQAEHNKEPDEDTAIPVPTTRREIAELNRLRHEHGSEFEAYVDHIWEGCPIEQMEDDFLNTYEGTYEQIDQFVDDTIDALGWAKARDEFLRKEAIPEGVLIFDRQTILKHLSRDHEFIQTDGWIHVFAK